MEFDPVAGGPMIPWVIEALRTRLPEMLVHAGAGDLASHLDSARIARLLPEIADEIEAQHARGKPVAVAES